MRVRKCPRLYLFLGNIKRKQDGIRTPSLKTIALDGRADTTRQHVMSRGHTANWYSLATGRQDVGIDASFGSAARRIRICLTEFFTRMRFNICHLMLTALRVRKIFVTHTGKQIRKHEYSILQVSKSRRINQAGHVAHLGDRNVANRNFIFGFPCITSL